MENSRALSTPDVHFNDDSTDEIVINPETGSPVDFKDAMPPEMPDSPPYDTGDDYPAQDPEYQATQSPHDRSPQPPTDAPSIPSYYETYFPAPSESPRASASSSAPNMDLASFHTSAAYQQQPPRQSAAPQHMAPPGPIYESFFDQPPFNGDQQSQQSQQQLGQLPTYTNPQPANTLAQPSSSTQEQEVKSRGATSLRPQKINTERKLTHTTKADYDSVLWRHPNVVQRWRGWGYNNEEIQLILQYFEQVSQVKGQDRVDRILQLRTREILRSEEWERLDPLDPFRTCPAVNGQRPGIPQVGSILGRMVDETDESVDGDRPSINDNEPNPKMTKGEKNYQLRGYRKHWQCLPIGTTCLQILNEFPNHVAYEFLDAFLQHRVMPTVIMDEVPQSIRDAFRAQNVYQSGQHGNIMTKRLNKRMSVLIEKAGYNYARVDQYLGSDIKLRELGFEKGPLDEKTSNVWNHQHNIEEGWRKWWATEKGKNELRQQGLEGQEPLPPNIPIKRSSHNGVSASATPSRSLPTPNVPIPTPSFPGNSASGTGTPSAIGGPSPTITHSNTVAGPAAHRSGQVAPAAPTVRPWNGVIEFSASITDESLGHFEGGPFWASEQEYLQHVQEIIHLNGQCKKLLTWIVEHDPAAKGSSATLEDSVSQALLYLIDVETDERYRQFGRNGHVPLSGLMEGNAIVMHLEAEIAVLLKESPNSHDVAVLKEKAQRRQVALHKAIAQSLASIISMVLFSKRQDIFNAATDRDRLHHARLLVSSTDDAIKAQHLQSASIKQKFFYDDELKTAMALEIRKKAKERLGAEVDVEDIPASKKKGKKQAKAKKSDTEFLQAMLQETRYQKADMIDTQLRVFADDPLNANLQSEAERNFDEIVEQILAELQDLNSPKVSYELAEQPAPEYGQPSHIPGPVEDSGQATHSQPSVNSQAPINGQSPKADKGPE